MESVSTSRPWRGAVAAAFGLALLVSGAAAGERPAMEIHKDPLCGCCTAWTRYVQDAGFDVTVHAENDGSRRWARHGIPPGARSCHTALVDGYVIEGHVPLADIERLLDERPDAVGLAVPGMPIGSPGMEGPNGRGFDVLLLKRDGSTEVYHRYLGADLT